MACFEFRHRASLLGGEEFGSVLGVGDKEGAESGSVMAMKGESFGGMGRGEFASRHFKMGFVFRHFGCGFVTASFGKG